MDKKKMMTPVQGSERKPLEGAKKNGAADPNVRIVVTLRLKMREEGKLAQSVRQASSVKPGARSFLSREEFEKSHGSTPEQLHAVETFAHEHGLDVVEASAARRTVVLSGTIASLEQAFDVKLEMYSHARGKYRGRTGEVHVPEALKDIVQGVFGLDDRPTATPHLRRPQKGRPNVAKANVAGAKPFQTPDVAKLYDFPKGNGSGQCIAIIELNSAESEGAPLGTGYKTADFTKYFSEIHETKPKITSVSVDHGHNLPGTNPDADGEVALDVEVAGAVAPGSRIAVYFAPNTDQGFLDAITKAIHDGHRKPSVVSISWGGPASDWTPQALQALN
jgi:kumamolisin